MMQAAYDEQDRQQQMQAAGLLGAVGGAGLGAAAGAVPHSIGTAVNKLTGKKPKMKPGFRAAGGLTGLILGGALGAGVSAMMQQQSPSARALGKIQAGGDISEYDRHLMATELASIYNNPSRFM